MNRQDFERIVETALRTIPRRFRKAMRNLAVVVEDEPSPELLAEMEIEPPDTLLGLYQGTPLTERGWSYGNTLPDRITVYQGPIERECETEDEMIVAIGETVLHEFGHYFGLSEEEIQEIEDEYWHHMMPDEDSPDGPATRDNGQDPEEEDGEDDEEDDGGQRR